MDLSNLCGHITLDNLEPEVQRVIIPKVEALPSYPVPKHGNSPNGGARQRFTFHDMEKRILGSFLPLTWQLIGSCVGHGAFNVIWRRILKEVVDGQREKFVMPYLPYMYGASRMYGEQKYGIRWGGNPNGSTGLCMAESCALYGIIETRPEYLQPKLIKDEQTGILVYQWPAKADAQWAVRPYVPSNLLEEGKKHLFKRVYRVRTVDQAIAALNNEQPITIAWNYNLHPSETRNGKTFMRRGGIVGGHQVCLTGYDLDPRDPAFFHLNSWPPSWMPKQADGPAGGGWIPMDDAESIITSPNTEVYAFEDVDGYAEDGKPVVSIM